jgi:hypothetical protein
MQDVVEDTFEGEWMAVFDLEAAYHNIRLHPDSYCLVGFMIPAEDGEECFYVFVVLPFGLASAAFVLYRMTKPVVQFLRLQGVRILLYVDDGRVIHSRVFSLPNLYNVQIVMKLLSRIRLEESSFPFTDKFISTSHSDFSFGSILRIRLRRFPFSAKMPLFHRAIFHFVLKTKSVFYSAFNLASN